MSTVLVRSRSSSAEEEAEWAGLNGEVGSNDVVDILCSVVLS